jgi:hypothetical protein
VSFIVLFAGLAFVFVLLLLGGSIFIQSWLYNVPASNIVLRALASGLGMSAFFTVWAALDAGSPGKFDSIFEGADLKVKEYSSVVSVRKTKTKDEEIPYRKNSTAGRVQFFKEGEFQKQWSRSDADGMMIALLIKEEGNSDPTRFEIKLVDGKLPPDTIYYEKDGRRYIDAPNIGRIVTPRSGSFFLRAFFAIIHFALWVVALLLGMQYLFGHALGLGFALWLFMTFAFLPIIFNKMRPEKTPETPAKVERLIERMG